MDISDYKKKEQVKCEKCDHVITLHKEDGCSFIESVTDKGTQKKCGCKYNN